LLFVHFVIGNVI